MGVNGTKNVRGTQDGLFKKKKRHFQELKKKEKKSPQNMLRFYTFCNNTDKVMEKFKIHKKMSRAKRTGHKNTLLPLNGILCKTFCSILYQCTVNTYSSALKTVRRADSSSASPLEQVSGDLLLLHESLLFLQSQRVGSGEPSAAGSHSETVQSGLFFRASPEERALFLQPRGRFNVCVLID